MAKYFSFFKVKKIYWVSRHEPLPAQRRELEKVFGPGVEIVADPRPFSSAEEIVSRFREVGAEEMVIVAPLNVIQRLTELGLRPLLAEMEAIEPVGELDPDREVDAPGGRRYRFRHFRRITAVRIEFEELGGGHGAV